MKSLESMTLAELRTLQEDVAKRITSKQEEERASVREEIKALAARSGFAIEDLFGVISRASAPKARVASASGDKRSTVAPKYQDKVTGKTWAGRGKRPKWVEAALASGKTLEDLRTS